MVGNLPAKLAMAISATFVALGACEGACGWDAAPPDLPPTPASVRGTLRVSAYADSARGGRPEPLRQRSVFVNGVHYAGMEDNDLRGFLDGRFLYGWNQPTQMHVRAGRRRSPPRYGERELFRALYRWDGIALPPAVRVHRARLEITVERGPRRELPVLLYAVARDWNPGEGGVQRNNSSPPAEGEVWWGARAQGLEPWGLPGAGFASDTHPRADTGAMPLAETRYAPGRPRIAFESAPLAAHVEARARQGQPLLFLLKLSDTLEDEHESLLWLYSGNLGDARNPERRPRLLLEWDSPAEVARWERAIHLEHGRAWILPDLRAEGARLLAASFSPVQGHESPTLELRAAGGASAWQPAALPVELPAERIELRLLAARNPLVLGEVFRGALRDTWVPSAPPEKQRVLWTFLAPSGERHTRAARYAGDYRWEVEFEPLELGRWRYFFEHEFEKPYRGAVGVLDVVAGDRQNLRRQLRALLERIRAAEPETEEAAVAEFGAAFWRLERAALQLETPESFASESGRELFDLLTEVREALARRRVPDAPKPRPAKREW